MLLVGARVAGENNFIRISHCAQERALVRAHQHLSVYKPLLCHSFRRCIWISKARRGADLARWNPGQATI